MTNLLRVALAANQTTLLDYISKAKTNNKVMRVTVPTEKVTDGFKLYPKPDLINRTTGVKCLLHFFSFSITSRTLKIDGFELNTWFSHDINGHI